VEVFASKRARGYGSKPETDVATVGVRLYGTAWNGMRGLASLSELTRN
jgi:hypothetical protein